MRMEDACGGIAPELHHRKVKIRRAIKRCFQLFLLTDPEKARKITPNMLEFLIIDEMDHALAAWEKTGECPFEDDP